MGGPTSSGDTADVLLRLPDANRSAFKEPLGTVHTGVDSLLASSTGPVVTIGDIVTASLLEAGRTPGVAVVDGRTKREPIDAGIAESIAGIARTERATNPPGTITRSLVTALLTAFAAAEPTLVRVDGEEDLAVVPAVLAAPPGTTVVYGQPGEGMVGLVVDDDLRARIRDLLGHLEGDRRRFEDLVAAG